jgi:hypothetical protein
LCLEHITLEWHVLLKRIALTFILAVMVNSSEPIIVFYNTLDCINLVATEKRNLQTVNVKHLDLLYLAIVHAFVFTRTIISINTYTIILVRAFLILSFGVECVSIYIIPLICHNGDYRVHEPTCLGIHLYECPLRNPISDRPTKFLMYSFANHDSLCLGLSLSNTSLCSSKYSDTMDICCNTWKWVWKNKFGYGVIAIFPMVLLPVSLPSWWDLGTPIRLLDSTYLGSTQWLPLYSIIVPCCPQQYMVIMRLHAESYF